MVVFHAITTLCPDFEEVNDMYVCNYSSRVVVASGMSFRPGPNKVALSKAQAKKLCEENPELECVTDLRDVAWERVPQPWRDAYEKLLGPDVLWGDAVSKSIQERERAWGDSIKRINRAVSKIARKS